MVLAGKNIIITGASRGFGLHIAQAMWNNKASLFLVARSSRSLEALQKEFAESAHPGQQVHTAVVDLKLPEATDTIMNQSKQVWERLDGLVNNAAILGPIGPIWENNWIEWQETIQVNLLAPIALCRACIPWMKAGGGGNIINISGGGAAGLRPNFTAYAVAKTGIVRFTEILSEEVKNLNIQVNSVAPGPLGTDMLRAILNAGPEKAGQKEYAQALKQVEKGEANLRQAAQLCVFLTSPASDGITGKLISAVWDPWEAFSEHRDDLLQTDIYTLRRILPKDRDLDWGER
jgi:NAD(P)-dependent dehydrogenase (short-subunit alcohol dehydrogenase family)